MEWPQAEALSSINHAIDEINRAAGGRRAAAKGLIDDPVNKTKSVVLTDEGLQKAEELFKVLFTRKP